jgi:hypothetical protein
MIGRGFILARMRVGDGATTSSNGDPGISSNGFVGGGQFGYNQQWGAWLGGLELDISAANVKGTANGSVVTTGPLVTTLPSPTPSLTNSVAQSENFHLLSSARARIGWRPDEAPLLEGARLIQFMIGGVDFIPLGELPKGVPVATNGGGYAESMAEHALAMALAAAKRLIKEERAWKCARALTLA